MHEKSGSYRRRRRVYWVVLVLILAVICEGGSYVLCGVLQKKWCMYDVPAEVAGNFTYEGYLEKREPIVGWPYPEELGGDVWDKYGARPSPAFPDPDQPSRVSLYGDSFTQSPCSDAETWGNLLAVKLGKRVANYGVGGYGTDQAFLRFRENERDPSEVVILSHMTENILRNLTRNRDLLTYQRHYAYKPRFVLADGGGLQPIPMPRLTLEEHLRCIGAEGPFYALPNESFQPGGPAGVVQPSFPFTLSILRNLGNFRFRARLVGSAEWHEFYERGHPLHGLEITAAICVEFARLARERGKKPVVFVLPGEPDLRAFQESGRWIYAGLVEDVRAGGIPCFGFGDALLEHLGSRDPADLFDETTHYRPEADAVLAEFAYRNLMELGLLQ